MHFGNYSSAATTDGKLVSLGQVTDVAFYAFYKMSGFETSGCIAGSNDSPDMGRTE